MNSDEFKKKNNTNIYWSLWSDVKYYEFLWSNVNYYEFLWNSVNYCVLLLIVKNDEELWWTWKVAKIKHWPNTRRIHTKNNVEKYYFRRMKKTGRSTNNFIISIPSMKELEALEALREAWTGLWLIRMFPNYSIILFCVCIVVTFHFFLIFFVACEYYRFCVCRLYNENES